MSCSSFSEHPSFRPLSIPDGDDYPFEPVGLLLGQGKTPLEVVIFRSEQNPTKAQALKCWHLRWRKRAIPLLVVLLYSDKRGEKSAAVCGIDEEPVFHRSISCYALQTIIDKALDLPDHHQAREFLESILPRMPEARIGINNQGLLPTYHMSKLIVDEEAKAIWSKQPKLESKKDRELIAALGYRQEEKPNGTSLLYISGRDQSVAVAVCLLPDEHWDRPNERHLQNTPVAQALSVADHNQIDYVIVVKGSLLRLYLQDPKTGLGRGGRNNTYIEADMDLIPTDQSWVVSLLFASVSLDPNSVAKPNLNTLLDDAQRFSAELGKRLRERVFNKVLPALAQVVAQARKPTKTEGAAGEPNQDSAEASNQINQDELEFLFGMAMNILFRLLFVAYAEIRICCPINGTVTIGKIR